MPHFTDRSQLKEATDAEIRQFFKKTTFEGTFSKEIRSKNTDYYGGSITDIKLKDRRTHLLGKYLNAPKTSAPIPEGPCRFQCQMDIAAYRADPPAYRFSVVGESLCAAAPSATEQKLFDMWGVDSRECIGYYHRIRNEKGMTIHVFDDLRKPNFDRIPYYPGDQERTPIKITFPFFPFKTKWLKPNAYYRFTWELSHRDKKNPYKITLDTTRPPQPIEPK